MKTTVPKGGFRMKNILIPIDGSETSMKAVEAGKNLAKYVGSKVTILNVVPLGWDQGIGEIDYVYVSMVPDEITKYSLEMLKKAEAMFDGMDNQVVTESIYGNVVDTILDYANAHGIDLIIMGSHGLGALKNRIMTGSVTTKVLHHTDVPVLVVK
jgi:nucleotide-binding universal stress UspA family protein